MNLRDFIAHQRLVLDDPGEPVKPVQTWSDSTIALHATHHIQSMSRLQAQRDQGFHNFTLILKGTEASSVLGSVWQWTLPTWVISISEIRLLVGGIPATGTTTFSPYMWDTAVNVGDPVLKAVKGSNYGWSYEGNRVLRLWGYGTPPDMILQVAKLPAPLIRATLDLDAVNVNRFRLPATLDVGIEDYTEGAFINAEFVTIGVSDLAVNVATLGQTRRCIYSKAGQIVSSQTDNLRRTEVYLEQDLPNMYFTGDTVETVVPMGDEHLRLILLLVARSCYAQIGNMPAMNAIREELAEQMTLFNNYITPRDAAESGSWRETWYDRSRVDQDQAPTRSWL